MISFSLQAQSSSESVHIYDYHVVYSFSYKVPVLYFQGHQAGMHITEQKWICHSFSVLLTDISNLFLGGQLLTLDEIKEDLPSHSLKLLGESKWTFITREVQVVIHFPWLIYSVYLLLESFILPNTCCL